MNTTLLQQCIKYLYPTAVFPDNYTVKTDANGAASIGLWDFSLGAPPTPEQLTAASIAVSLEPAKEAKINQLRNTYQATRYGNSVAIALASGATVSFPTDPSTQQNIVGYLSAYKPEQWPGNGVPLQDATGAVSRLTRADVENLATTIADNSIQVWEKLMALVGQVNAAQTVADVNAVTW